MKPELLNGYTQINIATRLVVDTSGKVVAVATVESHGNATTTEGGLLRHDREGWHLFSFDGRFYLFGAKSKREVLKHVMSLATTKAAGWAAR